MDRADGTRGRPVRAVECVHDRTCPFSRPTARRRAAYPPAWRAGLVEQVAGHFVADPYRWLEDPDSDESRAWLASRDVLTAGQLAALPARTALAARIAELTATGDG